MHFGEPVAVIVALERVAADSRAALARELLVKSARPDMAAATTTATRAARHRRPAGAPRMFPFCGSDHTFLRPRASLAPSERSRRAPSGIRTRMSYPRRTVPKMNGRANG